MLAPLLLIYFAWRCFLLFFWNPILLFIYAEEELYRGWIGKEILDGLKMSFFTYRADDYSGGSMLIGSIASAFFRVFGENSFSLKLIPVFLFAGALAAWYQWLAKYQSRRLAVFFSLAFIFSPLLFTRFSFTILGDHTETIFFTALTVLLFFNCLAGSRYRFIYAALLGLCAGLATWMAYIYAITVIAMGVYWFLQDRHFFRRPVFRITALFFLIGFSPWIYANLYTGFQGFFLQGTPLSECFHWKFFIKRLLDPRESSLYRLFSVHRLPSPVPEMPPQAVTHFYRVMYAAPVLLAFWKIRGRWRETFQKLTSSRSPLLFSVIYLSAFLLISQATDFRETRYYIPAQPFVFFSSPLLR